MQANLAEAQRKLLEEQEAKQNLVTEVELLKKQSSRPQLDSMATIEKLTEEINRLKEQLLVEERKNEELAKSSLVYSSNVR